VDVFLQMPDRVWEDLRAEIQGEAQKFNPFSLGAVKHLLPRKDARAATNGILATMPETRKSTALDADALKASVAKLPGWRVEQGMLTRTFSFPNFVEALAFVQSLGVEAEQEQHHPDLDIRYSKVKVSLVTHDAGGITAKDVALAQTADGLATPLNGK
jgi:4a-hydroxytetrahydrobiopterin dehydratase